MKRGRATSDQPRSLSRIEHTLNQHAGPLVAVCRDASRTAHTPLVEDVLLFTTAA